MKANEKNILKRFGAAVRKRRTALQLSQEAFAERAELHRTYIADIERGVRNLSLRNIAKIAFTLGLSLPELFQAIEEDDQK